MYVDSSLPVSYIGFWDVGMEIKHYILQLILMVWNDLHLYKNTIIVQYAITSMRKKLCHLLRKKLKYVILSLSDECNTSIN